MADQLTLMPEVKANVTPMQLLQVAMNQNADLEKLQKLMELQERWEANEARKAFNVSMAQFKAHPPRLVKNKHVSFGNTNYWHVTLDNAADKIIPALSAVGISHKWETQQKGAEITVSCILTHSQGHSETTSLSGIADTSGSKNAIQAIGSAITYLQRYTLLAATGLAANDTDDDGRSVAQGQQAPGMEEGDYLRRLEAIEGAATTKELQDAFRAAVVAAQKLSDKSAVASFTKAKDARKRELEDAGR